jgi:anaerobic selenocysteine-containing dehydrogenase
MTHKISRRDFLKIGTLGVASGILAGCQNPRRWVILEPFVRPPEEQLAGVANWYASTCRQCPAGCGIIVRIMNGRALKIEGNPEHPLNRGKLCARGQAGLQVLYNPDRLSSPVVQATRGSRGYQPITWEEGINTLFAKLQAAGSKFAIWGGTSTSGHLYTLFQMLISALGAPAPVIYDLYSGMTGAATLAQTDMALFGKAELPVYNLSNADTIISFNSDLLGPGLSQVRYGIEYGNFRGQANGKRGYLVTLEPRMSMTGAKSDLWLPIKPGSETLVAQAMIQIIADQSLGAPERVARAKLFAGKVDLALAASASDLSQDQIVNLARVFANSSRPLAIPSGALAGSPSGSAAMNAVQALNYIAQTAGQPGGMSLSAGQVLPKMISNPLPSPYSDVKALIDKMNAGDVQVLLVHGANPMYDLPNAAGFGEALKKVPYVVSFAPLIDETALQANLVLPDSTYLEGWGYDVLSPAFDVPVVSSQQPVVTPVFDTRATADVLLTVAKGLPAAAKVMVWSDEVAMLKDAITQLPAGVNGGSTPDVVWARFLQHGGWWPAAPTTTPAGETTKPQPFTATAPQYQGDEAQYPFFLHMYLSELLSDGRGANQPWLQGSPITMTSGSYQTLVEINPDTAARIGVADGDVVKVTSPYMEIEGYINTYPAMRLDTIAIATGQGHTDYGRYARQRGSNPFQLVGSQVDASGGSLVWSNLRVKIIKTGNKAKLALFEWKEGVMQGFPNEVFPGQ